MAKTRKNNRGGSSAPRRRRVKSGGISSWYLWIVVGVLILAGLFMLARTLSTAPPTKAILPVLASNRPDLEALTRMVGDIELDSGIAAGLTEELRERYVTVDSLIGLGDWPAALERLPKLPRRPAGEEAAVREEYAGVCHYRAVRPDHALNSLREAAAADSGRDRARQFRLAFAIGYLFQSRGFPDSALAPYATARFFAPADSLDRRLPAVLNNLALAHELTGDTAAALELYDAVTALVDTSVDTRSARVVRDNLRRLARRPRPADDAPADRED
ncbi:MAG: hypothetical protein R6X14_05840 [bacterium]